MSAPASHLTEPTAAHGRRWQAASHCRRGSIDRVACVLRLAGTHDEEVSGDLGVSDLWVTAVSSSAQDSAIASMARLAPRTALSHPARADVRR